MDEQRLQAYKTLIQQLLACPAGEEASVLQAQAELVDAGLVEVMRLVADQMADESPNNAGWLRQFAGQVAQALGLERSSASSSEDMDQFVGEVMGQIGQTRGNPEQVYGFWRANLDRLNPEFLATLPITFRRLIGQNSPELIAPVFVMFGDLIQQFPWGVRWLNLEQAIAAYERALEVYTRDSFPEQWAGIQNNLGLAYRNRIRGKRADNLELAISVHERALEVYTRDAFPEQWAGIQNNLGLAYSNRIRGDRADNLEQAIAAYERALEVRTRDALPEDWATTQNNLGIVYWNRIRGERADNLEQAIAAYERALEVRTRDALPEDWATTQNNLGIVYWNRIRGERADNLEQAIATYERALEVRTRDALPEDWAATQNNLGLAYNDRIRGERADNLER
ncbi:tetratricopeptide repeat protein, partial [Limnothrix redekei]